MSIVSLHQPHFLPWLGYFNKVVRSDVFVWLEDVQFRRRYYQNRAKIKVNQKELLITLPIKKAPRESNIDTIELLHGKEIKKMCDSIKMSYSKTPFFNEYFGDIQEMILNEDILLTDLNFKLFTYFLEKLEIKTEIIKSTSLNLISNDPNERLIEICKKVNGSQYIAGKGGRNYMDEVLFEKNDIEILWQNFPFNSIHYKQTKGDFVNGLSILDVLFNVGPEETRKILDTPWID